MRRARSLLVPLALAGCADRAEPPGQIDRPVVYGSDDRQDVFAFDDQVWAAQAAGFSAVMVPLGDVDDSDPDDVRLPAATLADLGVCDDERFADQPVAGICSATLIAPDLVLTAGHCIGDRSCAITAFVFDYYMTGPTDLQTITAADVFTCDEVLVDRETEIDYAVVRLDRPVIGRTPAAVVANGAALAGGQAVLASGFPSGLPLKIAGSAEVRDARAGTRDFFVANPDTFSGNSGSGVFDDASKELVGILVRGDSDYVPDQAAGCDRVNVCPPTGCSGEDSTYAFRAIGALCASGAGDGFDCTCGDGVCAEDESPIDCCSDCGCAGATDECVANECLLAAAPGDTCDAPIAIAAEGTQTILGDTFQAGGDFMGSCVGGGPDRVYVFTLAGRTSIDAELTGFDTGLYLRTDCGDATAEVECSDDIVSGEELGSQIVRTLGAGTYYLVVDGFEGPGRYTLTVAFEPADCPDRDGDATCDVDDACGDDPDKSEPGACGCGVAEEDADGDRKPDCIDPCPDDPGDDCGDGGCRAAGGAEDPSGSMPVLALLGLSLLLGGRTRRGTRATPG